MSQPQPSVEWTQSFKEDVNMISFLDPPKELRDDVYKYAFRVQGAIFMYSPSQYNNRRPIHKARIVCHRDEGPIEPQHLGRRIALTLLRTFRQLHAECSPVLYSGNVFRIGPLNDVETSLVYRQMVQHVVFMADTDPRLYKTNLEDVKYGWTRRFWLSIVSGAAKILERYPHLQSLTITLTFPRYGQTWSPAFFAVYNKTREQRIRLAVRWLHPRCPLETSACAPACDWSFRLRVKGSRFAPDDNDEDDWDSAEFAEAFKTVMSLS